MPVSTDTKKAQGRYGAAVRWGTPDERDDAARQHAAARILDYVRSVVDAAPPLTTEQRQQIAAALTPFAGGAA